MSRSRLLGLVSLLAMLVLSHCDAETRLELRLPLGRTCYQTNELIHIAVMRSGTEALPAGELQMTLAAEDESTISFRFPLKAAPLSGQDARATAHIYLRGDLLRPARYTLAVQADGARAQTTFTLFSAIRKSSFRLVDWGSRAAGADQAVLGENSLGFNLLYASYAPASPDYVIRGGLDYMRCCTMSGGDQMDLREECDWSDPYVLGGALARVSRQVFTDRTNPACIGVHFYDEPLLTELPHPLTGKIVAHNIPAQDSAFARMFGQPAPQYTEIQPAQPEDRARWTGVVRWKTGFLEAANRLARARVSYIRPDYLSTNQSAWAWWSLGTGNYFNEARSLDILNSHGGDDPGALRYFTPSSVLELAAHAS